MPEKTTKNKQPVYFPVYFFAPLIFLNALTGLHPFCQSAQVIGGNFSFFIFAGFRVENFFLLDIGFKSSSGMAQGMASGVAIGGFLAGFAAFSGHGAVILRKN